MSQTVRSVHGLRLAAKNKGKKIAFAEGADVRVREAARILSEEQLCVPFLIEAGTPNEDPILTRQLAERLFDLRKHKGLTLQQAEQQARDPLMYTALLLESGAVDGAIGGAVYTTAEVLRAGIWAVGVKTQGSLVCSAFLMFGEHGVWTFADCAVVPNPNAEQLAMIAFLGAKLHERLCEEPARVAMLSFSTLGSANHPHVDKVREATEVLRKMDANICCDGELQADAALDEQIAQMKTPDSPLSGEANVLIFPDLNSGNIGYKLVRHFAGLQAIGPVLMGLKAPFMDMSRGCNAEDLIMMACIASILAED